MPGIFDALPGIEVPVDSIAAGLDQMWSGAASAGKPSPEGDKAKAIQVNFVLHLGLPTDVDDALRQFDIAVRFSRIYPCRVVVLCPLKGEKGLEDMRAKVYGECTLGKSKDDTRCCEFVMLSYTRAARRFLENQVSICLYTDLPIYYWAHRFSDPAKLSDYKYLRSNARRVIVDSAMLPAGGRAFRWPKDDNVRDLAYARLLPVRQALGQFMGRYPAPRLGANLSAVELKHGPGVAAEAAVLFTWVVEKLTACGASGMETSLGVAAAGPPRSFDLALSYSDGRSFSWKADIDTAHATFDARLNAEPTVLTASVGFLSPEAALSEAMFF